MSAMSVVSAVGRRAREGNDGQRAFLAGLVGVAAVWVLTLYICARSITIPGRAFGGTVNDFVIEALPALRQLSDGHLLGFLHAAPAYVGSLIIRAPFAMLAMAAHGSWQSIYAATALPCVAAAPILGAWLASRDDIRSAGTGGRLWLWLSPYGVLLAVNPIVFHCLVLGHPEDVLGAALVVAGVVQAARDRPVWSMALLGFAVANKSWALVAVPVAVALMPRLKARPFLVLFGILLLAYLPSYVVEQAPSGAFGAATGTIFTPPQLWWWLGRGFWLSAHAHELIVISAVAASAGWRFIRRRQLASGRDRVREGLLLLALVLLLRAAMDPWDNVYYQLPFLMAVYALEVGRIPKLSFVVTIAMSLVLIPLHSATYDNQAVGYQLVVVPLIVGLLARVYLAPPRWQALVGWATASRRLGPVRSAHR